jgi:hypothetical protein
MVLETVLEYEADNDKVGRIKQFESHLIETCKRNNVPLAKHLKDFERDSYIPPPPQKILDLIVAETFLLLANNQEDPHTQNQNEKKLRLPFKRISLVPPENTKSFETVSLDKWRPVSSLNTLASINNKTATEKEVVTDAEAEEAEEILLADLTWDRERIKYVHLQWPGSHLSTTTTRILQGEKTHKKTNMQKKEETKNFLINKTLTQTTNSSSQPQSQGGEEDINLLLKDFYKGDDYEMVGVIFGQQFAAGGCMRMFELLPHLGLIF